MEYLEDMLLETVEKYKGDCKMKMILVCDCTNRKKFYFSDVKLARHFIKQKGIESYQMYEVEV